MQGAQDPTHPAADAPRVVPAADVPGTGEAVPGSQCDVSNISEEERDPHEVVLDADRSEDKGI